MASRMCVHLFTRAFSRSLVWPKESAPKRNNGITGSHTSQGRGEEMLWILIAVGVSLAVLFTVLQFTAAKQMEEDIALFLSESQARL